MAPNSAFVVRPISLLSLQSLLFPPLLPPGRLIFVAAILPESLFLPPGFAFGLFELLVRRVRRTSIGEDMAVGDELLVLALGRAVDVEISQQAAIGGSNGQRRKA